MNTTRRTFAALPLAAGGLLASRLAQAAIDNSTIGQPGFREHKATYGLVYRLPKDVNDVLDNRIYPMLRERLIGLGLADEARTFNLPHVTVVHIHSADTGTPRQMLKALTKVPPVLTLTLTDFYNTEASKGAGAPWWFDLGVVFATILISTTVSSYRGHPPAGPDRLLLHPDAQVRATAVYALGFHGQSSDRVARVLLRLEDRSPDVRDAAASVLARWAGRDPSDLAGIRAWASASSATSSASEGRPR